MDDLDVLARDFGLGARGKANPMRSTTADRRGAGDPLFDDVFGGQGKYTPSSNSYAGYKQSGVADLDYDSIFQSTAMKSNKDDKSSPFAVHDKPVYDDDIFDGLPGMKSKSGGGPAMRFDDDVFGSVPSGRSQNRRSDFDDLLGGLGRDERIGEKSKSSSGKSNLDSNGFDDLLAGFGSGNSNANRSVPESRWRSVPDAGSRQGNTLDNPFIVLESSKAPNASSGQSRSTDPLEEISKLDISSSTQVKASFSGGTFDDLDPLGTIGKPAHSFPHGKDDNGGKDRSYIPTTSQSTATKEHMGNSSFGHSKNSVEEKVPVDKFPEPPIFYAPNGSKDFRKFSDQTAASPQHYDTGPQVDTSPTSEGQDHQPDDIWLTVSDIPLFTPPSTASPPSRPPPPIPCQASRSETRSFSSSFRRKDGEIPSSSNYTQRPESPNLTKAEANSPPASQFDELEEFAMGRSRNSFDENDSFSDAAASAAAMKDAMDKAEAKFRHAKEVREREHARGARNKEFGQVEKDEQEAVERESRETQVRLERERMRKEEEEREQRRLERERLREIESEKARRAVERATREARERAAAGARERASAEVRSRAERAAVEKANAEARERAERASVQKAQAEARERAAAEAKEKAAAAAAEAKEKELQEKAAASRAEAEAKRRAERAAVDRAAREARERAASQARERAASAARMNEQKNDDDLESFFSMGRASSAPRASSNSTDPFFDQQFNSKVGPDAAKKPPPTSGASSTMKKASSATNFVDDLSSIFGAPPPSGEFQEVEGEPDERRQARMERHQRTQERAAKALAEKNQRDLQTQRDQEERYRIAETLDIEIKRWAAGKEGNLRALLSTLQYVLWPECGWQPVSLTDLITAASVKKVYRKATLCVHPDKVQQKGATLQQKYIAEKVFDLLKEAWNKFNSEELF